MHEQIERAVLGFSVPIEQKNRILLKTHSLVPDVNLIRVSDSSSINNLKFKNIQLLKVRGIENVIVTLPSSINVFNDPIKHVYQDGSESSSLYYVETPIGPHVYMLSFLPPDRFTSDLHYHLPRNPDVIGRSFTYAQSLAGANAHPDGIYEYYEILWGSATLYHSEHDSGYKVPRRFMVPPGVRHRLRGGSDGGALISILMTNAALYPPDSRHIR